MEQQTISISKAGINTTLNARTSILAAANPLYGRYDRRKKATENINLPAALLSRFDLLFLILDTPNPESDLRLAQHVTHVHMHSTHPKPQNLDLIDATTMRHYISRAKEISPAMTREVGDFLVNAYVKMRKSSGDTDDFQYTCPRTLLSVMRMSIALVSFVFDVSDCEARLRFSAEVDISDAEEAMRLIEVSKSSITDHSRGSQRYEFKWNIDKSDPLTIIFELIREMSVKANGSMLKAVQYVSFVWRLIEGLNLFVRVLLRKALVKLNWKNVWIIMRD